MAFEDFETADGSPVELITFQNGAQLFPVANTVRPYTIGATTFLPLSYTLSPFAQSKDSDDNNRTMQVPNTFGVANLFNGILTSQSTSVIVERVHFDDVAQQRQILWQGKIVAINHVDNDVELLLQPVTSGKESTPPDTFSSTCNAFLFESPGCNLTRADFRHIGTANAITNGGLNIQVPGLRTQAAALDGVHGGPTGPLSSDELDIYWQGGYIETAAGEIRDIVEGDVGGDPDVVRVIYPFRDLVVTDNLDVYAGCDLSRDTCHKKFNNVLNFQGYPDIPEVDPANVELPPGTRTSTGPFAGEQA